MKRRDVTSRVGTVDATAFLREIGLDTLILRTTCSPEQLVDALKTVIYCKEKKGEYRCEPKEPTNPFVARVCGNMIMLWNDSDPETRRQVDMGCELSQKLYERDQKAIREGDPETLRLYERDQKAGLECRPRP